MVEGEITYHTVNELKKGRFIVIDETPCRIVDITTSKPGKHGAAKARIVGIGIFDGKKRVLLAGTSDEVKVPVVKKKKAQVIAISGNIATLMDMETYETYDAALPSDMEISEGDEVEVLEALGRSAITKVVK